MRADRCRQQAAGFEFPSERLTQRQAGPQMCEASLQPPVGRHVVTEVEAVKLKLAERKHTEKIVDSCT